MNIVYAAIMKQGDKIKLVWETGDVLYYQYVLGYEIIGYEDIEIGGKITCTFTS